MTVTSDARQAWLGLLARAPEGRVAALLAEAGFAPAFDWLRQPEIGTVMVRGRMGGTGGAFNLSEMTVTRTTLKLACGTVGHGHVAGRRKDDAQAVAIADALLRTDKAASVEAQVLTPLEAEETQRRTARAAKAAATKVDFFTMVRGEG
ncbi:MAG: phosphonate C-P lyase system protein PhnG [Pseudomonadota bacterium]